MFDLFELQHIVECSRGQAVTLDGLAQSTGLSETIVRNAAVRSKTLLTVPCLCVPSDSLLVVLRDLKKRYPTNNNVLTLFNKGVEQYTAEVCPVQIGNGKALDESKALDKTNQRVTEQQLIDTQQFSHIPVEIREWTVAAMKEPDYNFLQEVGCQAECLGLLEFWTASVYKLHVEKGYYPKLAVRVRGCIYGWQGQLAKQLQHNSR